MFSIYFNVLHPSIYWVPTYNTEHCQYHFQRRTVILAVLFKLMLQHGYLPDSFMLAWLAMLLPILKNKTGSIISTDNHCHKATACSKIMETCLISRLESFLYPNDNQFAYKRGHSTDMCIYICLKILNIVAQFCRC